MRHQDSRLAKQEALNTIVEELLSDIRIDCTLVDHPVDKCQPHCSRLWPERVLLSVLLKY